MKTDRLPVVAAALTVALAAVACAGDDTATDTTTDTTDDIVAVTTIDTTAGSGSVPDATVPTTSAPAVETTTNSTTPANPTTPTETAPAATTVPPVDVGTVVVVAEETVLADLLSLGVPVAASSATVPDVGFSGMDAFDTSDIEIFDYLTLSLEELATYGADHIVTWQFLADQVGEEALAGVGADVHVLPDGTTGPERIALLGSYFGREAAADALIADLDRAYADAVGEVPAGCAVSIAAIYPGANVAAFAEPVWDAPRALTRLGCELVPSGDEVDTDRNGRAYLSLEQLGLLSAPTMVLLQSPAVEGDSEAVAEITANPLWQQLPAVVAGEVTEIDRIGYPGIVGEIRLIDELVGAIQP